MDFMLAPRMCSFYTLAVLSAFDGSNAFTCGSIYLFRLFLAVSACDQKWITASDPNHPHSLVLRSVAIFLMENCLYFHLVLLLHTTVFTGCIQSEPLLAGCSCNRCWMPQWILIQDWYILRYITICTHKSHVLLIMNGGNFLNMMMSATLSLRFMTV